MQITEYLNKRVFLIFLTVMLFFVSGCSKMPVGMLKQDAEQYTQEQIRLIAITERNRYQNIYTGQLWGVTADSNGNTFETLLKNQVQQFLEELAVVDRMAQEENISLTGQEEDDIKNLSSEFFQSLSNEDLNYLQITENDVLDLYRKYYLADKTVGQLTDTKNLEVSDAEAKVIQVERIETDSKDKAEALLSMVSEEKADFLAIAEKNSINSQIQYQIGWDTGLKEPDRSAFDLEENERHEAISLSRSVPMLMTRQLPPKERANWRNRRKRKRSGRSMSRISRNTRSACRQISGKILIFPLGKAAVPITFLLYITVISVIKIIRGYRKMTKDKKTNLLKGAMFAALLSVAASFPASAKEERTPVGHITLNFNADVQAGDTDATISVSVEDGNCSVESADFINEQEYWAGGEKPKVEVWLSADSDCYFSKSAKSAFTFNGDKVKYVSCASKYDKEMLKLVVTLEKLDKDDEDLDIDGLSWDADNGIANWDHQSLAKNYKVRLCRGKGSTSNDNGIGSIYTVKENSFNFSEKIPKDGTYYFKVRAVDSRGNQGDWEESAWFEVTKEQMKDWKGHWENNEKGWWYVNRDGSYPVNNWQQIDSLWYFFDEEGYMKTGWIHWNEKDYFCDESGAMLVNTVTPDGASVGADGAKL